MSRYWAADIGPLRVTRPVLSSGKLDQIVEPGTEKRLPTREIDLLEPRVALQPTPLDADGLGARIEKATLETVGVTVTFLGLLSAHLFPRPRDVYALVSTNTPMIPIPGAAKLTLTELDQSSADPALVQVFREGAAQQFKSTVRGAIQRALAKSVEHLGENFTVEARRCGWSQFLEHDTVGILSSAQGLLALAHANAVSSKYIEATAECLEAAQNNDGGWHVRSLRYEPNDISITESTCYCIWALRTAGRSIDSFAVSNGASWLMETQRESGGWGASERTKEANVLSTAFAVRVLAELGHERRTAKGIQWLRSMQYLDGGWGFIRTARKPHSSPAPTAHAVISLLAAGAPPDDPAVVEACAYLRAKFNDKDDQGPWQSTIFETLVDPGTNSRLIFENYATPWALIALVRAGASLSDDLYIQRGVDRLLDQQADDGAWLCNGDHPRERTVWAAHDAVYALQTVVSTGLKPSTPSEEKFKAVVLHALESWLS